MYSLILWSLAAVGFFGSLWLVLWFTQRVETWLAPSGKQSARPALGGVTGTTPGPGASRENTRSLLLN